MPSCPAYRHSGLRGPSLATLQHTPRQATAKPLRRFGPSRSERDGADLLREDAPGGLDAAGGVCVRRKLWLALAGTVAVRFCADRVQSALDDLGARRGRAPAACRFAGGARGLCVALRCQSRRLSQSGPAGASPPARTGRLPLETSVPRAPPPPDRKLCPTWPPSSAGRSKCRLVAPRRQSPDRVIVKTVRSPPIEGTR